MRRIAVDDGCYELIEEFGSHDLTKKCEKIKWEKSLD